MSNYMIKYTVYKWAFFWFTDVDSGGGDRGAGFLTGQQLLIIIIVAVVVGVFILIVCLILIIKCAVRNKLTKDDYMHVRGRGKPAHVWVTDYVRHPPLTGYSSSWSTPDGTIPYTFTCEAGVKNNPSSSIKTCITLNTSYRKDIQCITIMIDKQLHHSQDKTFHTENNSSMYSTHKSASSIFYTCMWRYTCMSMFVCPSHMRLQSFFLSSNENGMWHVVTWCEFGTCTCTYHRLQSEPPWSLRQKLI